MKILNNKILVKPDKLKEETESGLYIVKKEEEKPTTGIVEIGNMEFKKGDRIVFSKFGYDEIVLDKEIFYIISPVNIMAILD